MSEQADWRQSLKPGDRVRVRKDDGGEFVTAVRHEPWQLGHGEWVLGLRGIAGGYLLSRVQAVLSPEPTDNQEIEAAELAVRGMTCRLCGEPTPGVVNINFKAVPVCSPCTWAVTKQTVAAVGRDR